MGIVGIVETTLISGFVCWLIIYSGMEIYNLKKRVFEIEKSEPKYKVGDKVIDKKHYKVHGNTPSCINTIISREWDERFKEWIYKLDFWDGQNISVMESVLKSDFCYLEPTRYIAHEIR